MRRAFIVLPQWNQSIAHCQRGMQREALRACGAAQNRSSRACMGIYGNCASAWVAMSARIYELGIASTSWAERTDFFGHDRPDYTYGQRRNCTLPGEPARHPAFTRSSI